MKETTRTATTEKVAAADYLGARSRLVRRALGLGVSIVLLASVCLVVASHIGFEHMACEMAADALGSALSHSNTLARQVQDSIAAQEQGPGGALTVNAAWLRGELKALVINDPVVLYGMLLSKGGRILVHSAPALEGAKVENEGKASLLFASAREFPRGHLGYEEFIYEVRTPLTIGGEDKHMLVLGLSLKEIDKHIDEVRGEVRFKMLLSAAIGLAVLVVPGIGLWVVLRRYRQLARKARDMALMAQMGQMANGLAHEIRNPLNAVRFNLRIMEEDIDHFPEDVREGYKQIIRRASGEIDRVGGLLTEYLSYVRPGHREPAFYDVSAIVESVLDFVEYECRRYNIAIVRDLSPNLPKVLGDEKRLKQAVLNIVLNAQRTLRPSGGAIRARTHQDNGSVVLEIADNGPGVPEEERQKIFEPFYSTREGGTGLGLAIVQRVMEDHGGTIGCGCAEGGGAVFVATFPRQRERPHQAGTVERK